MTTMLRSQLTILICTAGLLGGCMQEISRTNPWEDWAVRTGQMAKPKNSKIGEGQGTSYKEDGNWAILMDSFEGDDRQQKAQRLKKYLEKQTGVRDLWYHDMGDRTYLYRGRYDKPVVQEAMRDLRQTRLLFVDGWRPYRAVTIAQVGVSAKPESELDLRNYSGKYTLQIAFYNKEFGKNYQKKAEEYVNDLRKQKFEAYYYHGPRMTNVTVGLFTQEEAYTGQQVLMQFSPVVKELQKKFPHNMGNNETVLEKSTGRPQKSKLVIVP